MPKLVWDQTGEKLYETGVEQVALYKQVGGAYPNGVAWNGVSAFNINPTGAEPTALYANNRKYLSLMSAEETGGTIEAYTYPDEWTECDGSKSVIAGVYVGQQTRVPFGLAVKTLIGNDEKQNKYGYKLHLIYGALASVSEKAYSTVNDSPEVDPMSWEFTTTPVEVSGGKFIKKNDSFAFGIAGPVGRNQPADGSFIRHRQAPDIHRLPLGKTDINKTDTQIFCHSADDGGFTQSRCAPDHQRRQRFRHFRLFKNKFELMTDNFFQFIGGNAVVHVNNCVAHSFYPFIF